MLLFPTAPARRRVLPTFSPTVTARLLIVIAFTMSGLGSVMTKGAYGLGATPVSFLLVRLITAVIVLVVACGPALWRLEPRRILTLIVLGFGFGAQTLAYFSAVQIAPVALVVVTVSTYPVVILVMDAVKSRRVPSTARLAAMAVSLLGLWLAAGSPTGRLDTGVLLALGTAVGYAVYLCLSAKALTPRTPDGPLALSPMVATAWVMIGALCVMVVVALVTSTGPPPATAAGIAIAHGIIATAVPIVAIYAALQRLRTEQVAVLGPLEPIVATGMAVLLLGESLNLLQGLGVVVVVAAIAQLSGVRPRAALPRLPFTVPRQLPAPRQPQDEDDVA
ncbi:MAG: DMT family transporter [Euzebya sp.]